MLSCDDKTLRSADLLIDLALQEDLQTDGDLTSRATIPPACAAAVNVVSREAGRLSGAVLIDRVYTALQQREGVSGTVQVTVHCPDGSELQAGSVVATLSGPVRQLLTGERVVLNFLIHLSGIASYTADFVRRVAGSSAVILDTRKTIPGYRLLHKYAVRCGGGSNHRIGLYDGMLIKDNHLAARGTDDVAGAVQAGRAFLAEQGLQLPVEVEVDTIRQLRDALAAQPDMVLLDNMKPGELQRAVTLRNELSPSTLLEASGGVTTESVGCIAGTGVDRISIGAITHSAPALDLGFDWSMEPSAR